MSRPESKQNQTESGGAVLFDYDTQLDDNELYNRDNSHPSVLPFTTHGLGQHHDDDDNDNESAHEEDDALISQSDHFSDHLPAQYLKGSARIRGPNTMCRMIFLTICLAGLQFTWTVEMAYGTPYLLSLGLSKSSMSLVWIAGPLSGLLMQPIVGVLSDRCTSRFGRRRPFLLLGSIVVVFSLLVIGWTREVTAIFTKTQESDTFKKVSIAIAITSIYVLDFSINCVQASCRALLVDSLPPSLQESGTAWAGRMVGLGNVAGYFMGYADLVTAFPFLGGTQLKSLCVVACLVLLLCDAITCFAVSEKILTKEPRKQSWRSPFRTLSSITTNIWNLPKPIRQICNVQFFAWIGWFPFLFYSTTWVAEIYTELAHGTQPGESDDTLGDATRAGSFAFLVYSLVSLGSSFLLPLVVSSSHEQKGDATAGPTFRIRYRGKTYLISPSRYLKIPYFTLPRAWAMSHFVFCIAMLCTFFVTDVGGASAVIGICGISWSVTMWAPFSLLGEYIATNIPQEQLHGPTRDDNMEHQLGIHRRALSSRISLAAGGAGLGAEGGIYQLVEQIESDSEEEHHEESRDYIEMRTREQRPESPRTSNEGRNNPLSSETTAQSNNDDQGSHHSDNGHQETHSQHHQHTQPLPLPSNVPEAGVLLGIHNMYIVLPQFLVTFFSSLIFHLLEKTEDATEDAPPNAIGVVLRFGAIMAGIACFLTTKIKPID